MHEIKNNIALRRQVLGFSSSELSRRLGVSRGFVTMLESGSRLPSLPMALQLARILKYPVEMLFVVE